MVSVADMQRPESKLLSSGALLDEVARTVQLIEVEGTARR